MHAWFRYTAMLALIVCIPYARAEPIPTGSSQRNIDIVCEFVG